MQHKYIDKNLILVPDIACKHTEVPINNIIIKNNFNI